MKRLAVVLVVAAALFASSVATAGPAFPDKGWHRGPYLTANVGMMQASNDNHSITNRKFDGIFDPMFGLSFGWDIADWIGPLLQMNYATATDSVGDPANVGAQQVYGTTTVQANTFPPENARSHGVDISLFARATLPYFVKAGWQPDKIKFIPFLKLGGTFTGVYVNSPTAANKAGAFGGGPAVGAMMELFIWKGIFVAIDATEHLIFQKGISRTINTVPTPTNLKLTAGGFKPQFTLQGMFGYHF